jgi:MoxR-like ATPase
MTTATTAATSFATVFSKIVAAKLKHDAKLLGAPRSVQQNMQTTCLKEAAAFFTYPGMQEWLKTITAEQLELLAPKRMDAATAAAIASVVYSGPCWSRPPRNMNEFLAPTPAAAGAAPAAPTPVAAPVAPAAPVAAAPAAPAAPVTEVPAEVAAAPHMPTPAGEVKPQPLFTEVSSDHNDDDLPGVFYPVVDPTYRLHEDTKVLYSVIDAGRAHKPQNVMFKGPHGCGKTEAALQYAAIHGLPVLVMDCANLREPRDWFGYKTLVNGTIQWVTSGFVKAIKRGDVVIVLDEANRVPPAVMNTLLPLLDDRRFTYLEELRETIEVGPGTVFIASANEGSRYTGTSAMDAALRDRFRRIVEFTYLSDKEEVALLQERTGINEKDAVKLVHIANTIRAKASGLEATFSTSVSTRQLLTAAEDLMAAGPSTLTFSIANHFSAEGAADSERYQVLQLIKGKFGDSK